ncbi:MAG TPA: PKD domain-containing protein, partial [Crocinitomicaceae bacterium]|nr:PKD domain-containing protein [Crocinitomicaceae bacterium]
VTYDIGAGNVTTVLAGGTSVITVAGATSNQTMNISLVDDGTCSDMLALTSTVSINPLPTATVVNNGPICSGEDALFTITGTAGATVTYDIGAGNVTTVITGGTSVITVAGATANQTINISLVDDGTCSDVLALTSTVVVNPLPTASVVNNGPICSGEDALFTITGTVGATVTYNLGVGNITTVLTGGTSIISVPGATTNQTMTISLVDDGTCTQNLNLSSMVVVNPLPSIYAGVDAAICEGDNITLTAVNPGNAAIAWNNGVVNSNPFSPIATTTYTVTATDANGCINTDDVTITVNPNPIVLFSGDVLSGCEPLEVVFANLTVGNSVNCSWDYGDGFTGTGCNTTSHIYASNGSYDVTLNVIDDNGCAASLTYTDYITVHEQAIANFEADEFENDLLDSEVGFTNTSTSADSYSWDFGDGSPSDFNTNPDHTFPSDEPASYAVTLIAYTAFGCNDTITRIISIDDVLIFYVPNTFTPDNDELNQRFLPVFTSGYDPYDYHLTIFNRWGEVVFESYDSAFGWDGTYHGKLVQDGTYTWKIDFKETMTDKRHSKTGHVNVIR